MEPFPVERLAAICQSSPNFPRCQMCLEGVVSIYRPCKPLCSLVRNLPGLWALIARLKKQGEFHAFRSWSDLRDDTYGCRVVRECVCRFQDRAASGDVG